MISHPSRSATTRNRSGVTPPTTETIGSTICYPAKSRTVVLNYRESRLSSRQKVSCFALLTALCCFFTIGCGSGGDDDAATPRDAAAVRTEQAQATNTQASTAALALGSSAKVGDAEVTVISAERKTPADLANRKPTAPEVEWVLIQVAVTNASGAAISTPDFNLTCADGSATHRYADDAAGALAFKDIPAKSKDQGRVLLGVPANCLPGTLTVKATGVFVGKSPAPATWKLP